MPFQYNLGLFFSFGYPYYELSLILPSSDKFSASFNASLSGSGGPIYVTYNTVQSFEFRQSNFEVSVENVNLLTRSTGGENISAAGILSAPRIEVSANKPTTIESYNIEYGDYTWTLIFHEDGTLSSPDVEEGGVDEKFPGSWRVENDTLTMEHPSGSYKLRYFSYDAGDSFLTFTEDWDVCESFKDPGECRDYINSLLNEVYEFDISSVTKMVRKSTYNYYK